MLAVQPQPEGVRPRIVTLIASPGSAPSTWTGPVTGFTLPKSSFARSASVDFAESWAPEESMVSNSTVSPGATARAGVLALFQPIWQKSEEHKSELQSLMRISYAVLCLKKKKK